MKHIPRVRNVDGKLAADMQVVRGAFSAHLESLGLAYATVYTDKLYLIRIASWLHKHGRQLSSWEYQDIPKLIPRFRRGSSTGVRQAIRHWLRFQQKPVAYHVVFPWEDCLVRYHRFAIDDCGLAESTCRHIIDEARRYLTWQFGAQPMHWARVGPRDIWRYAEHRARNMGTVALKGALHRVSCFLRWAYLCGDSKQPLMNAIPRVANFRMSSNPSALTETGSADASILRPKHCPGAM